MTINLKEITKDNFREVIKLEVNKEQNNFVAPNLYSIAQSKIYPTWQPMAVYKGETLIGFVMYGRDDLDENDESVWIIRMMIDKNYQSKGLGNETMAELLSHIKKNCISEEVFLSFVPENKTAKNLYEKFGFNDTGRFEEGEVVYKLNMKSIV